MNRKILTCIVMAGMVALPAASSAKPPPSVALWMAKRDARITRLVAPMGNKCVAIAKLTNDDDKTGACLAQGLARRYVAFVPSAGADQLEIVEARGAVACE